MLELTNMDTTANGYGKYVEMLQGNRMIDIQKNEPNKDTR